jgi:hypothetical protein
MAAVAALVLLGYLFIRTASCAAPGRPRRPVGPGEAWFFPFEPPAPTDFAEVPDSLLRRPATRTLGDLGARLEGALASARYGGVKYLRFQEDGFVIITRLEGILEDGTPRADNGRWEVESPPLFTLHDYLEALLHARHGRYRVWVFAVTTHTLRFGERDATPEPLSAFYDAGITRVPAGIAGRPFLDAYHCTALTYEFERPEQPRMPRFLTRSAVVALEQLRVAGIESALSR